MSDWRVIVDGARPAEGHMACDERLAREPIPTVRFFTWDPPALSLGWKQPEPGWLAPSRWAAAGLELVRRPTGGGIACHGSDLSLAVIVPRAAGLRLDALMDSVCQSAALLCRMYGAHATTLRDAPGRRRITYCLAETSPYAVMIGARKVAGFALRRYPRTWLIQGSLLVRPLVRALKEAMPPLEAQRLHARAVPLADAAAMPLAESDLGERWAGHWSSWWAGSPVGAVGAAA